ncbi:MAG: FHA domain-containing protein [Pirellulaceae bacterium]
MFYKLVLQNHVDGLGEKEWNFRAPAVVGRDPGSDVCFEHDSISRKHCQFSLNGEGALIIKDLESMNGIYVNDRRVQQATLMPHQTLQIGSIIVQVEFTDESEMRKPAGKPKGSVYSTQPMQTLKPMATPAPIAAPKSWWQKLFG